MCSLAINVLSVLDVPTSTLTGHVAGALLGMPQLRKLRAWSIEPSEAWHGTVTVDCGIEELCIAGTGVEDATLKNIPQLPQLKRFAAVGAVGRQLDPCLACDTGVYAQLMALLQRQAETLRSIVVSTHMLSAGAQLPAELPACRELQLLGLAVGRDALQPLSGMQLPALWELGLGGTNHPEQYSPLPVLPELLWLVGLPVLQKVSMAPGCGGAV
jgi:hypothetical protein